MGPSKLKCVISLCGRTTSVPSNPKSSEGPARVPPGPHGDHVLKELTYLFSHSHAGEQIRYPVIYRHAAVAVQRPRLGGFGSLGASCLEGGHRRYSFKQLLSITTPSTSGVMPRSKPSEVGNYRLIVSFQPPQKALRLVGRLAGQNFPRQATTDHIY